MFQSLLGTTSRIIEVPSLLEVVAFEKPLCVWIPSSDLKDKEYEAGQMPGSCG